MYDIVEKEHEAYQPIFIYLSPHFTPNMFLKLKNYYKQTIPLIYEKNPQDHNLDKVIGMHDKIREIICSIRNTESPDIKSTDEDTARIFEINTKATIRTYKKIISLRNYDIDLKKRFIKFFSENRSFIETKKEMLDQCLKNPCESEMWMFCIQMCADNCDVEGEKFFAEKMSILNE